MGPDPVAALNVPEVVVHAYVFAPEAVTLTVPPLTTEADDGVNVTVGPEIIVKTTSFEYRITPKLLTRRRNFTEVVIGAVGLYESLIWPSMLSQLDVAEL
jgi:hypothetical protein